MLNHLVDTSFSGSVTRTTGIVAPPNTRKFAGQTCTAGGVWMSVTPTDEALIVALDIEGCFDIFMSN